MTPPRQRKQTNTAIVIAARDVFIHEGHAAMSIRKVAKKAGISVGNLTYHFPSKRHLVEEMIDHIMNEYLAVFERYLNINNVNPAIQLSDIVSFIFCDLANPTTTLLFPELIALANHEEYAAKVVEKAYKKARSAFVELIPKINSSLSVQQVEDIALFMSASIEGHAMFVGANKEFSNSIERLTNIANISFINIILNTCPEQS